MLAMLAGHKRYAHIAALRCDAVLPELLGMSKIVSEDAVRRAFKAIEEKEGATWLRRHLAFCAEPLLAEPWILDVDTTIKPLYGRQEGAVLGYNPKKPGRPSHCYHTYSMASTRLVLDVDVCPGDEHASKHGAPSLGVRRSVQSARADVAKSPCRDPRMPRLGSDRRARAGVAIPEDGREQPRPGGFATGGEADPC